MATVLFLEFKGQSSLPLINLSSEEFHTWYLIFRGRVKQTYAGLSLNLISTEI